MQKIAAIRSKEIGSIASILDNLYASVRDDDMGKADILLTSAINEKRHIKSGSSLKK